ncbi:MAG: hypothetical protein EOP09_05495 [Proteobacteria bacterium]|nr:MAG: hypothetical protein EOP09_05495 [Pseudomonadota bacterium]
MSVLNKRTTQWSGLALGLFTLLSSVVGGYSSPAEAAPYMTRARCFAAGSAGNMGRTMGARNASRIVNAVWARLGQTCNQVDRLAQILSETPLARPTTSGEFAACFYLGYTEQIYDTVDEIYGRCGTACFSAGAEIGKISAQGYCAASMAVGGLLDPGFIAQPPLPFCGSSLVMGCKAEYIYTATVAFPGCSSYTDGFFTETFDNTVRQDCYVPADIPIRDHGFLRLGSTTYSVN